MNSIIGIDPGKEGAIVLLNEKEEDLRWNKMPLGADNMVDFKSFKNMLSTFKEMNPSMIILERSLPFKMGRVSAFNYGRDFAAIESAIKDLDMPYIMVEPVKWTKKIHQGIDSRHPTKKKSEIALKRLLPKIYDLLPRNRNGKILDGPMDAVLLAYFGMRHLK